MTAFVLPGSAPGMEVEGVYAYEGRLDWLEQQLAKSWRARRTLCTASRLRGT
jgi:hypothetical protein